MISEYLNNLNEALEFAQKKNFSSGIIKGMQSIHEGLGALEPLLKSEDRKKRLKADVEKLLEDLRDNCRKGEEGPSLGNMRQLRDRVQLLKSLWSK